MQIAASKSLFNRALILQSFDPNLEIIGESNSDDVKKMQEALSAFNSADRSKQTVYDCGSAGTTLRFLAIRLSRTPGNYILQGSSRLFTRPQGELIEILKQLGVAAHIDSEKNQLNITSTGWKNPNRHLTISQEKSSQFISAVLLASINLDFPIEISLSKKKVSDSYLAMTIELLSQLGVQLSIRSDKILIRSGLKISHQQLILEPDASSVFSVVALATLNSDIEIDNFQFPSIQPDAVFVDILNKMEAAINFNRITSKGTGLKNNGNTLKLFVSKSKRLNSIHWNMLNCPDLFPVLSALCCFADSESTLVGAEQLVYKESNRLLRTKELLEAAGIKVEILSDGLKIYGRGISFIPNAFEFDPDEDHRMAMAAAIFKSKNSNIRINSQSVVNKSFPEYWEIFDRLVPVKSKELFRDN